MNLIVAPLPFDAWETFEPFAKRFTDTFKLNPPGADYVVWAVCNWGEPTDKIREMFYGVKTIFTEYYSNGCDIGSAQYVAKTIAQPEDFMVCMTTRCYFHREGWLAKMAEARQRFGPGLYGCSANHENQRLHLCTRVMRSTPAILPLIRTSLTVALKVHSLKWAPAILMAT